MRSFGLFVGLITLLSVGPAWGGAPEPSPRPESASVPADVAEVPSREVLIDGDSNKRYFLIGHQVESQPPKDGYQLVIVLPGGDGGAAFNPFVRRIYKHALGPEWLVAQAVAVNWGAAQQIVWPTQKYSTTGQQFSTEDFIEAIAADVKRQAAINPACVFTLSWSSSGPAAYAASLQPKKTITGAYIAMSVFRPEWLPPLAAARGHKFFIDHSPQDRICPFTQAQNAAWELAKNGARVELNTYEGGHGWRGDVYGRIRKGLQWLCKTER